ncbi:MAG: hypothetical protein WC052_04360 [Patescibacteria group bacterium]
MPTFESLKPITDDGTADELADRIDFLIRTMQVTASYLDTALRTATCVVFANGTVVIPESADPEFEGFHAVPEYNEIRSADEEGAAPADRHWERQRVLGGPVGVAIRKAFLRLIRAGIDVEQGSSAEIRTQRAINPSPGENDHSSIFVLRSNVFVGEEEEPRVFLMSSLEEGGDENENDVANEAFQRFVSDLHSPAAALVLLADGSAWTYFQDSMNGVFEFRSAGNRENIE